MNFILKETEEFHGEKIKECKNLMREGFLEILKKPK
jgi:hypothetical protein